MTLPVKYATVNLMYNLPKSIQMKHDINALPIVPYIIAERALWNVIEADKKNDAMTVPQVQNLVDKYSPELVQKAETLYKKSDHFRKLINDKRKDMRYTLEMFMEHWADAILNRPKRG